MFHNHPTKRSQTRDKSFSPIVSIWLKQYITLLSLAGARFEKERRDTLILTDGQSNCNGKLANAAMTLQQNSNVYALAIGLASDTYAKAEISSLVSTSEPNDHRIFSLSNFEDFKEMTGKLESLKGQDCLGRRR